MPDEPAGPMITVGYSVQNDGQLIGIHFDLPLSQFVVGFPLPQAKALAKEFGPSLEKVIQQAERTASGLVIAPGETLNTLKGK